MFNYIRVFVRLHRDAKLYLVASGLIAFAYSGLMGVLFNLYLARLGFGAEFIGLLIGSGQLVWALLALPAGAIGVRIGLARALVLAGFLIALGFSLVLCVEWLPRPLWEGWLIGAWMLMWLGAAFFAVNGVPFMMAATTVKERGHAFSLQSALSALLALTGSLVAGWLPGALAGAMGTMPDNPVPYRLTLWIAPVAFVLAALIFTTMRPVAALKEERAQHHSPPINLFVFLTTMVFLGACGEGAVRSFYNLYLDRELTLSTTQIGAAMGFSQVLPVLMALLTPLILARLGSGITQAVATVTAALCIGLMGMIPHWLVATAALMGIQGTFAVIGTARSLFSQEIVSAHWRTTTAALATVGLALGWAVAAAFGGYAIAVVGFRTFFLASSILTLASAMILLVHVRRTNTPVALRSVSVRTPVIEMRRSNVPTR